ncbi:MAG TPA: transglycosylase SLT domain-containing protein [Thermoanaerobaculia bacterium]|nr:transglycosylase SLT domain-containing protein [Thermoanaerobaculia bacterium]
MTGKRALLLLLSIVSAGCSSTFAPSTPAQSAAAPQAAPTAADSAAYRAALEDAYTHIVAREGVPVNAPKVDVEAAVSMEIPDHKTIRGALTYFTTELKPSIQESLLRSAKYRRLIDKALDEYKLPKGLAYLPVIESAYVPTLTSRAGAHGIWQFMPDTAREYGLRVDWWVDERADPERSTRAAAKYIRDLYRQFNDWPLTLAAYNAGPGRIHRALETNNVATFWELLELGAIPKETRGYVPTFFATLMIASDPQTYGFKLNDPAEIDEKRVEVTGPLSLSYLAEAAQVDEAVLKALNPALRRGVVPPGRLTIRVPSKAAETVASRAATLKNDDANIAICSFTLRGSDRLERIARAIGSTTETILAMNDVRSADRLRAGDSIYLPVRARELGNLLSNSSEVYYAVAKGDTYYSIAKKHNLSVDELLELNDLRNSHKLHPGEKLRVTAGRTMTAGGM